jgi:hypothetical protein
VTTAGAAVPRALLRVGVHATGVALRPHGVDWIYDQPLGKDPQLVENREKVLTARALQASERVRAGSAFDGNVVGTINL